MDPDKRTSLSLRAARISWERRVDRVFFELAKKPPDHALRPLARAYPLAQLIVALQDRLEELEKRIVKRVDARLEALDTRLRDIGPSERRVVIGDCPNPRCESPLGREVIRVAKGFCRVECPCGTCGPWADERPNAVRAWNQLPKKKWVNNGEE